MRYTSFVSRQGSCRLRWSNQASNRSRKDASTLASGARFVVTAAQLSLSTLAMSCVDEPYAWERGSGPAPTATVAPLAPSTTSAAEDEPSAFPGRAIYVRCLQGLEAEGDPLRDAHRLALSCGPAAGMRPLSETPLEGALAHDRPPLTFALTLQKGRCYRLFGAADLGVTDLDVEVRSSREVVLASDHGTSRLAVVQPDRPFCALEDGEATVVVSAKGGRGAFALFAWVL